MKSYAIHIKYICKEENRTKSYVLIIIVCILEFVSIFSKMMFKISELQSTNTKKKCKNSRKRIKIYTNNSKIIRGQMRHSSYPLLIYCKWLTMDIVFSGVRKLQKNENSWISYLRTSRQTAVSYCIKQKSRSVNCSFVLKVESGSPNWIRTNDLPVNSRLLYRWAIGESMLWLPE